MARQMHDPDFRNEQFAHRFDEHVRFFNDYVLELGMQPDGGGVPPFIAPHYKPQEATLLALARDPGPMAGAARGSGFLSYENDDPSAERMECFFREAGIDLARYFPWNAYPWYVHDKGGGDLTAAQLDRGLTPLMHVIDHLPRLHVIVGFGTSAGKSLKRLQARHGDYLRSRGITCLATIHTSRQALFTPDPTERERREQHLRGTLKEAALLANRDSI